MRALIVKTSSMGDIIHTLPALTDAKNAYPNIEFDWVVEESWQTIPLWHHAVTNVIPINQRRWKKEKGKFLYNGELFSFLQKLRNTHYDIVIDAQGLLKSAWIAFMAKATTRAGYSWQTAKEPLASLFYLKTFSVPKGKDHAVDRIRSLFAKALQYSKPEGLPDYGIKHLRKACDLNTTENITEREHLPYFVFVHGTTWKTKEWPENYWRQLAENLSNKGYGIKIFWYDEAEKLKALRISDNIKSVEVLPKQTLEDIAMVLSKAHMVITVDTGLGHLAAALNVPTLSLYGPTTAKLTGTYGEHQMHLQVDATRFACSPCFSRTCMHAKTDIKNFNLEESPCFESIPPSLVMQKIEEHANKSARSHDKGAWSHDKSARSHKELSSIGISK